MQSRSKDDSKCNQVQKDRKTEDLYPFVTGACLKSRQLTGGDGDLGVTQTSELGGGILETLQKAKVHPQVLLRKLVQTCTWRLRAGTSPHVCWGRSRHK